ncbi:hypothetical protein SCP_0202050 [Sparassis crispa]|uniref:Uncharacterized protein n=1 Tax=Sparassis crispa TaxID=139825 RepID=A0A401GA16_9APHY|nr:hypothetical protein SCP_0202050 [Sparassis crispa]GBE79008.1 hypothetical protein SCP_0202050 [Sparassis crispa]
MGRPFEDVIPSSHIYHHCWRNIAHSPLSNIVDITHDVEPAHSTMNNTPEERYAAHALYSLQAFNHTQPVPTIRRKAYTVVAPNLPEGHCKTSFTVQGATPDDVTAEILGADMASPIQRHFPVLEFIEKVWKYSPEKLADILHGRKIRIPIRSYVDYWTKLRQHQSSAMKVFTTLLTDILYQISGTGACVIPAEFHHKQSASGYGGSPPDISWTTVDDVREQRWTWTISCVEVDLSTFRQFISKHSYHKLSTNKWKAVPQEDSCSPSSRPIQPQAERAFLRV